jgi:hypothetical protein
MKLCNDMHQTRDVYGVQAALLVHMQRNIHVRQVDTEQSPTAFEMRTRGNSSAAEISVCTTQ